VRRREQVEPWLSERVLTPVGEPRLVQRRLDVDAVARARLHQAGRHFELGSSLGGGRGRGGGAVTERDDSRQGTAGPDSVTVLTGGGEAVWLSGPVRVSLSRPCVIDARGVTLYRWPWRSILILHERVDRFDVVAFGTGSGPVRNYSDDAVWYLERLVLRRRDGEPLSVCGPVRDFGSRWRGPSIHGRATHLNNHLARWRAGGAREMPRDAEGEAAT
jgi:hypothetical protein